MSAEYMRTLLALVESSGYEVVGFHVTDRSNAEEILQSGFLGGWGDVGFGVYFWNNIYSARQYASEGGWDGELTHPVIIQVIDPALEPVTDIHPDWDASLYLSMLWVPMDQNNEEQHWKPQHMQIIV